mmetsp:Transcript_3113/g.8934  ORF Transcript_3113/g.8934 Transcript_3113/m.8934 type:complete len:193 (-) Transcript_3113:225-803(-)
MTMMMSMTLAQRSPVNSNFLPTIKEDLDPWASLVKLEGDLDSDSDDDLEPEWNFSRQSTREPVSACSSVEDFDPSMEEDFVSVAALADIDLGAMTREKPVWNALKADPVVFQTRTKGQLFRGLERALESGELGAILAQALDEGGAEDAAALPMRADARADCTVFFAEMERALESGAFEEALLGLEDEDEATN